VHAPGWLQRRPASVPVASVTVPVVDVRRVRVIMDERRMPVNVRVRLDPGARVLVPVVLVVDVLVLHRLVQVCVAVSCPHDEHDAERHEGARGEVRQRQALAQEGYGDQGADERGHPEERRLPCGADRPDGRRCRTMLRP
jgi:hypothetical protein